MREIFTIRFFAAAGAVVGLFLLLTTVFATREVIDGGGTGEVAREVHTIDFVEQVFSSRNPRFRLDADGVAVVDTDLIIDGTRQLRVVAGTPGQDDCPKFGEIGACAVVADLLGEAVVWFALVPMGSSRTVGLPAIDTLEDGQATLVNGWRVPYASVLDRRCGDEEFVSYQEFRDVLGDNFTSIFDIDARRLIAVECRVRVPYAPVSTTGDPDTTDPRTTDPRTTDPGTTDPGTTDPGTTDPGTTDPAVTTTTNG